MPENPPTARAPLSWTPPPGLLHRTLAWFALGGALIGLVGFADSFANVTAAARPYLGRAAVTLPILVDLGIFTLSGLSIALELGEIKARWIRLVPTALVAYTIYLNTATQPTWFAKAVHAAGPVLWVTVVEIGAFTVRRIVGLTSATRMDKVRRSRWLLAPASTFRLWRRMRLWEITDYPAALAGENQRLAAAALLRQWYGRRWKHTAPRAQRLAVTLHGANATGQPVAEILTLAKNAITQAAASATQPDTPPAPTAPERAPASGRPSAPTSAGRVHLHRSPSGDLLALAARLNERSTAATGAPISARQLARELRIGQDKARALIKQFPGAVTVTTGHAANGHAFQTSQP